MGATVSKRRTVSKLIREYILKEIRKLKVETGVLIYLEEYADIIV